MDDLGKRVTQVPGFECAWCGGECGQRLYRNRHGDVFCSNSHRSSSNRVRAQLEQA